MVALVIAFTPGALIIGMAAAIVGALLFVLARQITEVDDRLGRWMYGGSPSSGSLQTLAVRMRRWVGLLMGVFGILMIIAAFVF